MNVTEWSQQMTVVLSFLESLGELKVQRNDVGNLSLFAGETWVGFIDVLHPTDSQLSSGIEA